MKKFLILFVAFILVCSCSTESDDNIIEETPQTSQTYYRLVKTERFNPDGVFETSLNYEYDSDNNYRLSRTIGSKGTDIVNFVYNSDGKLTSIYHNHYLIEIQYNDELIVSITFDILGIIIYLEYFYNSSDQVVSVMSYQDGEPECEISYIYDNQGNVSSSLNSCSQETTKYFYDNMKNPDRLIFTEAWLIANTNPFNNLVYRIVGGNPGNPFNLTITYEYNTEKYPTISRNYFDDELINYKQYFYETFED